MRSLIVGCGFVGLALGRLLRAHGHEVFGVRRAAGANDELEEAGITPLRADVTRRESLESLPAPFDWIVNTVSSGGGGASEYQAIYVEGTLNLLAWLAPRPPLKFVYTSSTSVYGQTDGSIVTETSPAVGASEPARQLCHAEELLLEAARERGFPAIILRLAGLYGAGRGRRVQEFLHGQARIRGDGLRWLNLLHRDDAASAILAALERGRPGEIYNVADNESVTELAYYQWLAARFDRERPAVGGGLPPTRKRGLSNKRVSNQKLRDDLGWRPAFPTFREGYAAEFAATGQS